MLTELVVGNLVIVAKARLAPGPGLTVISGETGAGKSLLLDAIALLTGSRAQGRLVGPAGDEATVSAAFHLKSAALSAAVEAACGVAVVDGELILRRRLAAGGRSQAWINDTPVTVAALKTVAALLIDLRAQYEALRLAEPQRQLELLDAFGGLVGQAAAYRVLHRQVGDRERELASLDGGERESLKELDWLRFQLAEFAALRPLAGELATLEARHVALSNVEAHQALAARALETLSEGDGCVAQQIAPVARRLAEAADSGLAEAGAACRQALDAIAEATRLCAGAADRLQAAPDELARVSDRIDAYHQLMRKHGEDEGALLAAGEAVRARIGALSGLSERRAEVAVALDRGRAQRAAAGAALAAARTTVFAALAEAVHAQLADLGMPKARMSLSSDAGAPGEHGTVVQELLVATNPGLPPGRLGAIASGGESARLALALAVVLAGHDGTPVVIFDEIDSGVGGRLAGAIGAKLAELSHGRTVLAITHTPHVAAAAHRHYVVRKQQGDDQTTASVSEVTGAERLREIADMLGGGAAAREQARTLLGQSAEQATSGSGGGGAGSIAPRKKSVPPGTADHGTSGSGGGGR